ncbi:HDOD domain-containing protein [uncultured Desulfuromusa sp.]|uniref:HDOD domain-containing protein n=1 Tax=uncultured Desulfuromusa sp. TaxID=219183 RepID=UPI002AA9505F|nr:HDOD domain-containing protein [uncultured Desulfuromusa sp.]
MIFESLPTLDEIVVNTNTICSPPLSYNRLNDAINHPETTINEIVQIISEDAGLTARVLKLVNSPLYHFSKVDSIGRAVTLLGTKEIRDLALTASMIQAFPGISENLLNMQMYWSHSVACGVVARNIATYLREPSIERFFVAGILHDIGQLVLCASVPEIVKKMTKESIEKGKTLCDVEREHLHFDHSGLGGALLKSWGIPQNIYDLVEYHHNPSLSLMYPRDATIVHVADIMCQALSYGITAEVRITSLDEDAYDSLNLPTSSIATIIQQSELQLKGISSILLEDA